MHWTKVTIWISQMHSGKQFKKPLLAEKIYKFNGNEQMLQEHKKWNKREKDLIQI